MATNNKYDRQLRLWGARGQMALGETHVLLVGSSAAGTETLKNLVLPGIGSFVVLDVGVVSAKDACNNFFLPQNSLGSIKAETASHYLQELNPDVKGSFRAIKAMPTTADAWKTILDPEISKSQRFVVVAADLPPLPLESLAEFCRSAKNNLPMVVVESYGLIGCVRLQLPAQGLALLEPKPINAPPDLRLVTTFPAFVRLADSINLEVLDSQQHGRVPYPILLYKAAQAYRQVHSGNLPSNFAEKQDFKVNYVQNLSRDYNKELNFQEAVANSYLAYTERDLVLPDDDSMDTGSKLSCLYKSLHIFMKRQSYGRPPLNGSIPDMSSSTELYVQLQRIYKEQADQDLKVMQQIVKEQNFSTNVTEDDVANFCANVYVVGHVSSRSLHDEISSVPNDDLVEGWKMALMDPYEVPIHTPLLWYLGLRACHLFCKQEERYPGMTEIADNDAWKKDIDILTAVYKQQVIPHYQLSDQTQSDQGLLNSVNVSNICHELTRYANADVHTIASVVGGVASQEAVKIITGQYIPVDNVYVYNGIVSVGGVYKV